MASSKKIRLWALQQVELRESVGKRGRLNPAIIAAYNKAHGNSADLKPETVVSSPNSAYLREARIWARGNGYEVGDRGRIPHEILVQYRRYLESADVADMPDAISTAISAEERINNLMRNLASRGNALWQQPVKDK